MERVKIDDVLKYEQPTKYIVETENYHDDFEIPVLTAGKSFVLGYTNEVSGIFNQIPVIIFDDFTTAFHYVDFPFKVKSSAMKILKIVEEKADLKYLYYKMQTISVDKDLHKRYWISKYSQLEISLPPLSTQKTIAAKLDKAQEIISYNKQLVEKYDQLTHSLFIDMFGSGNPKRDNWEEVKIENVVKNAKGSMRSGPFGSDLLHSEFVETGIPVLGIDNAVLNKFQWKQRRYITEEKYQKLKRYTVYPKDIIITIMGTVGRVAVVPDNIGIAINTKHLAAISLNQKIANPEFIAFSLRSDHNILSQINQKGKGAIMTGLNLTIIKELKLKLPPIHLQNQFSERMEKIEIQKQMAQETLAKSEHLFQSLLKESFR